MKKLISIALFGLTGCVHSIVVEPTDMEKVKIFLEYRIDKCLDVMIEKNMKGIRPIIEEAQFVAYLETWEFIEYIENEDRDW